MEVIRAADLRQTQYTEQTELIYNKIKEAVRDFKCAVFIKSDFKLNEESINIFRHKGYIITTSIDKEVIPYKYIYKIDWK